MSKSSSLYTKMSKESVTLAPCPVTGIVVTLNIPALPFKKVLSYELLNPFSLYENIQDIASLPLREAVKVSNHILAGCLITVLTHHELLQDSLSGIERNLILSQASTELLHETIRFFCSSSYRRFALYPRLSLESETAEHSSITHVLKNYMECCSSYHVKAPTSEAEAGDLNKHIAKEAKEAKEIIFKVKEKSISSYDRRRLKNTLNSVIAEGYLNNKTIAFLKIVISGNNLITMEDSLKDKLISKLLAYESPNIQRLASLIEEASSLSSAEKAFKQEADESLRSLSDSFVPLKVKRTLKEILEEKRNASSSNKVEEKEQEEEKDTCDEF